MNIRDALPHEVPIIREQRVAAYSEHAESIPTDHWNALRKAISSDADIQPGVELIVAEIDGKILGSVALFPPKTDAYEGFIEQLEHAEIRLLAVSPAARGKGVASALIQDCIERTKAKGYDAIGLHTGDFMESAMALYERIGFERLPKYDFEPANDGIIVKAFRLKI
ncbi:GNAT family N-acetyltransferase [Bacillus luteolus]|uniref:GNAT family N-acetyltransferase n=1 Tax=Litchfieldia luteola TaxID=682179 RepID=A0ABR9QIX1_9BACI|nr:GNAT family N-acetyltransferase [Cytobacillus luteolus]MBE4908452.1 GNAT family N-acetyltransferase [Cytobacillus luteolus]MBP1941301.1 GNAT superfamily N-acetyltransferase [Cytobacillus luteolus]